MLGILVDVDQMDSYGDVGKDCALAFLGVVLEFIAFCALTGAGWFRQCRNCGVRSWCCPSLSLFTAVSAAATVSQMSWTAGNSGDGDLDASSFSVSCVLGSVAQGFQP